MCRTGTKSAACWEWGVGILLCLMSIHPSTLPLKGTSMVSTCHWTLHSHWPFTMHPCCADYSLCQKNPQLSTEYTPLASHRELIQTHLPLAYATNHFTTPASLAYFKLVKVAPSQTLKNLLYLLREPGHHEYTYSNVSLCAQRVLVGCMYQLQ